MLTRAHGFGSRVKQLFTRSVETSMRWDRLGICDKRHIAPFSRNMYMFEEGSVRSNRMCNSSYGFHSFSVIHRSIQVELYKE